MTKTGVKATAEETAELRGMAETARSTPYLVFGGVPPPDPWDSVRKRCHAIALVHGLPEITGYYGIDESGEFVRV